MNDVHFLLNTGLNVASVHRSNGQFLRYKGYNNGNVVGEGLEYVVTDTLTESEPLCIEFTGKFPVYAVEDKSYKAFDFKGLIAFNGRTLRAAEQSKWYPVLYDSNMDQVYERVTYDLQIRCPDCAVIYVNGTSPEYGQEIHATSALPYAPLMFAGAYRFKEVGGTLYLNSEISREAAHVLSTRVAEIKTFYEHFLSVPYTDTLVFLEHEPVEYYEPGRSWGFVTWPTVAFAGIDLDNFVREGTLAQPWIWRFLSHEIGHYFFGTLLGPAGPYKWFFLEAIPEYLALKAVERFAGEEAYVSMLSTYYRDIADEDAFVRLDRITESGAIGDLYRYRYGPLLLEGLEREIGAAHMRNLLHAVVTTQTTAALDYEYLSRLADQVGVSPEAWRRFEEECVRPPHRNSCLERLAQ